MTWLGHERLWALFITVSDGHGQKRSAMSTADRIVGERAQWSEEKAFRLTSTPQDINA